MCMSMINSQRSWKAMKHVEHPCVTAPVRPIPTGKIGQNVMQGRRNNRKSGEAEGWNELKFARKSRQIVHFAQKWGGWNLPSLPASAGKGIPFEFLAISNRIWNPRPSKKGNFHLHSHWAPSFYPHWLKNSPLPLKQGCFRLKTRIYRFSLWVFEFWIWILAV